MVLKDIALQCATSLAFQINKLYRNCGATSAVRGSRTLVQSRSSAPLCSNPAIDAIFPPAMSAAALTPPGVDEAPSLMRNSGRSRVRRWGATRWGPRRVAAAAMKRSAAARCTCRWYALQLGKGKT